MSEEQLVLRYSHNIVEHLGLKLYQNKPTNVIAELVSNGWDGDAKNVWIDINSAEGFICVSDDGDGMSSEVIRNDYLIIGKPKRDKDSLDKRNNRGRKLMGRKGLGKLAPFGIASIIDVLSVSLLQGRLVATWFRMNLDSILERSHSPEAQEYKPDLLFTDADAHQVFSSEEASALSAVKTFQRRIADKTGTFIMMRKLSLRKSIDPSTMRAAMGRRFTVTLIDTAFAVHVNEVRVTGDEALPSFDFRVPVAGTTTEEITMGDIARAVTYWVGFVERADWPQDQAGIGVYTHGKIAQDRPFTFGVKGREIWTRYMYGVVEADWIDELPDDLVSTDRTSIDWERDVTSQLYAWGEGKVRQWTTEFARFRAEKEKVINRVRITKVGLPKVSGAEVETIADLLSKVTPELGNDDTTKDKLAQTLTEAWLHRPMRELVQKLWKDLNSPEATAGARFLAVLQRLRDQLVPESLSLAVTFAQRVYALTLLYDMVHKGKEPDLQELITIFPWILHPDMELLTANESLKTVVRKAEEEKLITWNLETSDVKGGGDRPDFVFFSSSDEGRIVVVEIKSPRNELTLANREQLAGYLTYFEQYRPTAKLSGKLIGGNAQKISPKREDIEVLPWDEVLSRSRMGHIELLAAMLDGADPDPLDARVLDVARFGGKETIELLKRLAREDHSLSTLLQRFPNV